MIGSRGTTPEWVNLPRLGKCNPELASSKVKSIWREGSRLTPVFSCTHTPATGLCPSHSAMLSCHQRLSRCWCHVLELSSFIRDLSSLRCFAVVMGRSGLAQKLFYLIDPALAKCRMQTLGHHSVVTAEGQESFPVTGKEQRVMASSASRAYGSLVSSLLVTFLGWAFSAFKQSYCFTKACKLSNSCSHPFPQSLLSSTLLFAHASFRGKGPEEKTTVEFTNSHGPHFLCCLHPPGFYLWTFSNSTSAGSQL